MINLIKIKYFIKNNKINILFIDNKNAIDLKILENIFREYSVLGKINFNNKELINKKIINKMKGMSLCN